MGRKTILLNDELRTAVLLNILNGNTIRTACLASGVSESSFFSWMQKGQNPTCESDYIYVEFLDAVKKAQAMAIQSHIKIIEKAAKKDWQAAAWWLERNYPALFGKRVEVQVQHSPILLAINEQSLQLAKLLKNSESTKDDEVVEGEVKLIDS